LRLAGDLAAESANGRLATAAIIGMISQDSLTGDLAAESANGRLATEAVIGMIFQDSFTGDRSSKELEGDRGVVLAAVQQHGRAFCCLRGAEA
jgi:hypothetical protein